MVDPSGETEVRVPHKDDLILELDQAHAAISRLRAELTNLRKDGWLDPGYARALGETITDQGNDIEELRAVLAPLLDEPLHESDHYTVCKLCGAFDTQYSDRPHGPDCPVLRKDELLGRVHA